MIFDLNHIIEGCRKRDPRAQRSLYEQYSARMYGVCLRYCGSAPDAQDALHEGFVKIFEKINQFESKGAFEGWVRRIMVNTALEKYRRKVKLVDIEDGIKDNESVSYDNAGDDLSRQEILKLIDELSPQYKTVFNLYAIEGYSHKEISEMLNINEGTSKSNLSRARSILQEKVKVLYNYSIHSGSDL